MTDFKDLDRRIREFSENIQSLKARRSEALDRTLAAINYINTPISADSIIPETRERIEEIADRCERESGPRFVETITDEGWFVFDRATHQYLKKTRIDDSLSSN